MRTSQIIQMGPKYNGSCPYKRPPIRETCGREGGRVRAEAEIMVIHPETKEKLEPLELETARKNSSQKTGEFCQHLNFRLLTSTTGRELISLALSRQTVIIVVETKGNQHTLSSSTSPTLMVAYVSPTRLAQVFPLLFFKYNMLLVCICLACSNKTPQTRELIKNRNMFLIVLEV